MARSKQAKALLERLGAGELAAMEQIGQEIQGFIPVATGRLRGSTRISQTPGQSTISVGRNIPYAEYQYFRNLRHLGSRGQYKSLGTTPESYRRNYEKLKPSLQRSRALWFNAVLRSSSTKVRVLKAFVGKARLRRSGAVKDRQRFRKA